MGDTNGAMRSLFAFGVAAILGLVACSGADDDETVEVAANPCATPGATYYARLHEQRNGTCGPVSDQIVNLGSDGQGGATVNVATPRCKSSVQDGCTAKNTGCVTETNGIRCETTTSVTFAADGSSAEGLMSIRCSDDEGGCSSTYLIEYTRQ